MPPVKQAKIKIELYNSDTMTLEQLAEVEVLVEKYGKDEFGGFYDPKSGKIYLNAAKLDGTQSQVSGILANELTHYVDHKKEKPFNQQRQDLSTEQQQNLKDQLKSYGVFDSMSEEDRNKFTEVLSKQNFDQGNKNAAQVSNPEPAYFGKRPLGNTPGMALSKIDDKLNTEIAHEQLFFEDKEGENLGFLPKKNKNSPSVDTPSLLNKYIKTDPGYDDAIMRQAVQNVPIKKYHLIGNNCQDWADDVRKEYKKLLKKAENKKP